MAAALVVAGCGGGGGQNGQESPGVEGGGLTLTIEGFAFQPATLTGPAGQEVTVTVTNEDGVLHSLTVEGGADADVPAGETVEVALTFPDAGSVGFRCKYHSAMTGTLAVG